MNKSLYQKCSYYHKQQIKNNFWKYWQKAFKLKENVVPDVYKKHASHIFVTSINTKITKSYSVLQFGWKNLINQHNFDLMPSSSEVAKIVNKMVSSALPCSCDEVSSIVLKKCPIVRAMVWSCTKPVCCLNFLFSQSLNLKQEIIINLSITWC